MAVYTNDLRLKEIATGDESGTWGTSTNTNLSLVAEAFSFGTEAITTNADTHTTTLADGATDPGRSMFLKYTGTLDSTCTITIGPNTISKLWFIENATSGSQNIIIKQGSGATITVPNGQVKAIYSDGAGSGGAMVDAFQDLSVPDLFVDDDLTVGDDLTFTSDSAVITFGADGDTTLTHTDGSGLTLNSTNKIMFNDASQFIQGSSSTVLALGATDEIDLTATAIDVNGTMDVSGALTGTNATFTTADNTSQLTIKSTDGDANAGPVFDLVRDSGSPADDDVLGRIRFRGDNDAGEETTMVYFQTNLLDASDGTEDAGLDLFTKVSGTLRRRISLNSTEAVFNDDSRNLDFRVESDGNTHMLFVDAENNRVGIGTSSPGTLVEASESQNTVTDVKVTNANTGTAAQARFTLGNSGSNFGSLGFTGGSFTTSGVFRQDGVYLFGNGAGGLSLVTGAAQPIYFAISNTEAMRILADGKVSIGGTSSNQLLNVTSSTTPALEFTRGSGNATIGIDNGNSIAVGGTAGDLVLRASGTTGVTKFTDSGGNITMTLTEANNVGIGTSSPSQPFHVDATGGTTAALFDNNGSNGDVVRVAKNGTDVLKIRAEGTADLALDANGGDFIFKEGGTERMRINSNGSVGIHTSSLGSSTKLTVAGRGLFTGGGTDPGDGSAAGLSLGYDTSNGFGFIQAIQTGVANKPLRIQPLGTDAVIIGAGGAFCGIGTTSPAQTLHVKTGSDGGGITIQRNSTTENTYAQLGFSPTTNDAGTPNISIRGYRGASFSTNYLTFVVGGSGAGLERARLDGSGNFLLGRTSRLTSQVESISSDTVVSVHGTLTAHQTNAGIMQYTSNLMLLRCYGATSGTGEIAFRTGGGGDSADGETMRISSDFKVGIGTSSPATKLDVNGGLHGDHATFSSVAGRGLKISTETRGGQNDGTAVLDSQDTEGSKGVLSLQCGGAEKLRVEDTRVMVGKSDAALTTTGIALATTGTATFSFDLTSENESFILNNNNSTGTTYKMDFRQNNSSKGQIVVGSSSTAYNTSSDYRLKENVTELTGATARLKQLTPKRFNFIAEPDITVDGFLAHEVSSIVPEAINGEKDAVDDNGNPQYQGIDQSKLVPLLVATIQELEARITALEAE